MIPPLMIACDDVFIGIHLNILYHECGGWSIYGSYPLCHLIFSSNLYICSSSFIFDAVWTSDSFGPWNLYHRRFIWSVYDISQGAISYSILCKCNDSILLYGMRSVLWIRRSNTFLLFWLESLCCPVLSYMYAPIRLGWASFHYA